MKTDPAMLPDVDPEMMGMMASLFANAVSRIVKQPDPQAFIAWLVRNAAKEAPFLAEANGDDPRMLIAIARDIWNATPLPDHHFQPRKLAKPERNEPCYCGSGRKFKQCCGPLLDGMPSLIESLDLLPFVLMVLPKTRLKTLPASQIGIERLSDAAATLAEGGDTERAVAILEPLFKHPDTLDERAEFAFDALMDCYLELEQPLKRQRLLKAVQKCANRTLCAAAWQRAATMAADQGDFQQAWAAFREAQRQDPEHPSLCLLELTLLGFEQASPQRLSECARRWSVSLRRRDAREHAELIETLDAIANQPEAFLAKLFEGGDASVEDGSADWLQTVLDLLGEHPPQLRYRLSSHDGIGEVQPEAALAGLEQEWMEASVPPEDGEPEFWEDAGEAPHWLPWLQEHPDALDSFAVLRDLFDECEQEDVQHEAVQALLERVDALFELLARSADLEHCQLPWGLLDNRPLLWLLSRAAAWSRSPQEDIERRTRLLALNPEDNLGQRMELAHTYLILAQAEPVLELCVRYPDDCAEMRFDRVLALYMLGRQDEARAALSEARKANRHIVPYLTAASVKEPEWSGLGVSVGGKDEAWVYRENYRELWVRHGAIDWLKKQG